MPLDDAALRALMEAAESFQPVIEWAEGQKAELEKRGWSHSSAEAYALELLLGAVRLAFLPQK